MKKTHLAPIFVYLHHAVALTTWRAHGFLDWLPWRKPSLPAMCDNQFIQLRRGLHWACVLDVYGTSIPIYRANVGLMEAWLGRLLFSSFWSIYSRMCLRERIHLLNLAAQTTDVTHIEAGEKLQATSPNGSPWCLTKQRDWRVTIICSFERKYQGLTKYCSLRGVQILRCGRTFLISSEETAIVHRLQLLHTPMTASAWNVLLPFEVIKLDLEYH